MKMKEKIISITNIIKSKVLPFFIIFVLVFPFSLNIAVAQDFTYSSETKSFSADMFNDSDWVMLYNFIVNQSDFDDYSFAIVCYDPNYWQNHVKFFAVALCSDPIINCGGTGQIVTEYPDSDCVFFVIDSYNHEPLRHSYSYSMSNDVYVYTVTSFYNYAQPAFSYGYTWCSSSLRNYEPNLIFRDSRFLSAEKSTYYGIDFIEIVTNDSQFGGDSFVTFTGLAGSSPFTQTFGFSSFSGVAADNPYTYFYINPLLFPYDSFTISSVEYENRSGSYGSKIISTVLDFGTPTSTVPVDYNVNTTINSFT